MIVSHTDKDYLNFTKVFLYSISKYAPQEKVYLSTINLQDSQIIDLTANSSVCRIVNHSLEILEENKIHLLQNRVTKVIQEAQQSKLDTICIVMNIDMLVRKPLDFLYEQMQNYDIGLCFNSGHPKLKPPQIMNGFMVFNLSNSKVLEFVNEYDQKVHDGGKEYNYDGNQVILNNTFHRDQEVLHSLYVSYKDSLRFLRLDRHVFINAKTQKNGAVWAAGRWNKFEILEQFKKEIGYKKDE